MLRPLGTEDRGSGAVQSSEGLRNILGQQVATVAEFMGSALLLRDGSSPIGPEGLRLIDYPCLTPRCTSHRNTHTGSELVYGMSTVCVGTRRMDRVPDGCLKEDCLVSHILCLWQGPWCEGPIL